MKNVIKRNGERAEFDVEKLKTSLLRAGANRAEVERVVDVIAVQMTDGMSTHALYKLAYAQLRQKSKRAAGRYRLKKAILDMGPTGHPFEFLVGELMRNSGYRAEVGVLSKGHCVGHELDVVAHKEGVRVMIECKFHNDIRRKSDVKVSLYIQSRFLDMKKAWEDADKGKSIHYEGWIVTNTRFTGDALQYGTCAGLKMISWDYPVGNGLREMIDKAGFHPVTAMQSLTKGEKEYLLDKDIILCRTLIRNQDLLAKLGKTESQIRKIVMEATQIVRSE